MKSNKEKVVELLKSIETGDREPASYINPTSYTQHNLSAADGMEGFGEILGQLAQYPEPAKVETIRAFEDGDYVFTHTHYNFFGEKAAFDIFRFEDGMIVEHWDNMIPYSNQTNPNGHSPFDGVRDVKARDMTQKHKALAERFVKEVLCEHNRSIASNYIAQNLISHLPLMADGLEAFTRMLDHTGVGCEHRVLYEKLHKVLGEGNFVLTVSEGKAGSNGGQWAAYYDLFRFEDQKIVEWWCVTELIPEQSQWKNSNGKFAFPS